MKKQQPTADGLPAWHGEVDIPATRRRLLDYCEAYRAKVEAYNRLLCRMVERPKLGDRIRAEQELRKMFPQWLSKEKGKLVDELVKSDQPANRHLLYLRLKRQPVNSPQWETMVNLVYLFAKKCRRVKENRLDPRVKFTATNGCIAKQRYKRCLDTVINHRQRLMEAGLIDYRFRGTRAAGEYRLNTTILVPKVPQEETLRYLSAQAQANPELQLQFRPGSHELAVSPQPGKHGLPEECGDKEHGDRHGYLKEKSEESGRTPAAKGFATSAVSDLVARWNETEEQARNQEHHGDRKHGNTGVGPTPKADAMETAGKARETFAEPKASELIRSLALATTAEEKRQVERNHYVRLALHTMLRLLYPDKTYAPPVLLVTLSHIEHFFDHLARDHRPVGKFTEFQQVVQHRRYYLDLNPHLFQVAPHIWTNPKHPHHLNSTVDYYRNRILKRQRNDQRYYSHLKQVPLWVAKYFREEDGEARLELIRQVENRLGSHRAGDTKALQVFYDCIAEGPQRRKHLPRRKSYTGA